MAGVDLVVRRVLIGGMYTTVQVTPAEAAVIDERAESVLAASVVTAPVAPTEPPAEGEPAEGEPAEGAEPAPTEPDADAADATPDTPAKTARKGK